jgi:hypothetical protein
MAPEPPSISEINGAAILNDNMEDLLFTITSSFLTTAMMWVKVIDTSTHYV